MGKAWGVALAATLTMIGLVPSAAAAGGCTYASLWAGGSGGVTVERCDGGAPTWNVTPPTVGAPSPPGVPAPPPTGQPPAAPRVPSPIGDTWPWEEDNTKIRQTSCAKGWVGTHLYIQERHHYACVRNQIFTPSSVPVKPPGISTGGLDPGGNAGDTRISTQPCTGTFLNGQVVHVGGTATLGLCLIYQWRVPTDLSDDDLEVDAEDCSLPDRPGADPAVWTFGGGVAFCVVPVVEVGEIDWRPPGVQPPGVEDPLEIPVGVDLSPCSLKGVDPAVTIGDGGVYVCIEAQ